MFVELAVLIGIYMAAAIPLWLGGVSVLVDWTRRGIRALFATAAPVEPAIQAPVVAPVEKPARALVSVSA